MSRAGLSLALLGSVFKSPIHQILKLFKNPNIIF